MANNNEWMSGAIRHKGALTKKANAAKMGVQEFAQAHKGDSGTTGKQARLAITFNKYRRGKE